MLSKNAITRAYCQDINTEYGYKDAETVLVGNTVQRQVSNTSMR